MLGNMTEQETINEQIQDEVEEKILSAFDQLSAQINAKLTRSMEVSQQSVFKPLRVYFTDLIEGHQPTTLKEKVSKLGLSTNIADQSQRSPKTSTKPQRKSPGVRLSPNLGEQQGQITSTSQSKKYNLDILGDIKQKLKQYEQARQEMEQMPTEENEPEPAPRPGRDSNSNAREMSKYEKYIREPSNSHHVQPSSKNRNFLRQHRTIEGVGNRNYLSNEPRRENSQESEAYNDHYSPDETSEGVEASLMKYRMLNSRPKKPFDYSKPAANHSSKVFLSQINPRSHSSKAVPSPKAGGRDNFEGSSLFYSGNIPPTVSTPGQQYVSGVSGKLNYSNNRRAGAPFFEGEKPNIQKNSAWYFESMKTINDLKNFRDNVRSKLSLAQTNTPSHRQPMKYTTPRYGLF